MHYKFTGKERDAETGLDFFGARYYASTTGRWMSPDWAEKPEEVPYAKLDDPQSLNLYGYVGDNPLGRVDIDGHQQLALAGGGTIAVTASGTAATGTTVAAVLDTVAELPLVVPAFVLGQIFSPKALGDPAEAQAMHKMALANAAKTPAAPTGATPLPANPDDLTQQGYHDTSHPDAAAAGHRTFTNPQTGDKVRHDQAKPGAPSHAGKDHYHRYNPKSTGKSDQYLDKDGKPTGDGSGPSHLKPEPPPPPQTPKS